MKTQPFPSAIPQTTEYFIQHFNLIMLPIEYTVNSKVASMKKITNTSFACTYSIPHDTKEEVIMLKCMHDFDNACK